MPRWFRQIVFVLVGFPPDDLSPKTLNRLQIVFVAVCVAATAIFIVALFVILNR